MRAWLGFSGGLRTRLRTWRVNRVPLIQHVQPFLRGLDRDEPAVDLVALGVVRGEADAELAHQQRGLALAVDGLRQAEVILEDLPLLGDGGGLGLLAAHQGAGLPEDPRVADAASRDADGVHTGVLDHPEDVLGGPDVAGAEDDAVWAAPDEIAEEAPVARADVLLRDGAPVDGGPGDADLVGGVEEAEEVGLGFGRVVGAAADLHGDGDLAGDGVAHGAEDLDGALRLTEPVAAPGFARPPAMKPTYAEDGVTVLRWKEPAPVETKPAMKTRGKTGLAPESSAKRNARTPRSKFVPKEPHEGAWILQGEMVEAKLKKNWYAGKVKEISAHGNHLVKFNDGDESFHDEYQIRRVVPWSVGETVEILISDDGTTEVHHTAFIVSIGKDGNITSETVKDKEIRTDHPSKLRRPVTTVVKEKPGHSYSTYG